MKGWTVVYLKELKDYVSDKRIRTSAFIMPVVLVVMMFYMFGTIQNLVSKPSSQTISVLNMGSLSGANAKFVDALKLSGIKVVNEADLSKAEEKIQKGDIKVLLSLESSADGQIKIGEYFDPANEAAQITVGMLDEVVRKANTAAVQTLLKLKGIPSELAQPIKVTQNKVHAGAKSANEIVIALLPYFLVLWAFYGGMGAVGEIVAGEKEKNTLETLLTVPLTRSAIALGKLLSMTTLCFIGSLSAVVGVVLSAILPVPQLQAVVKSGLGISFESFAVMIIVLIPTALMFSAMMVAISTKARNTREAMTKLSVLSTVVILPAVFSQFIGLTDFGRSAWVNFVPVLNSSNTMRLSLTGSMPAASLITTVLLNGALGLVFLFVTQHLFNRESVLERI